MIFTEILADPSPQVDLPGIEFAEIYNNTDHIILLKNWKVADPQTSSVFGSDSIAPGQYAILCAKADTAEFRRFGKTIGISPWPGLNNSSDILRLISPESKTIDSVAYSDSWFRESAKKSGGWSLERADLKSVCEGPFNWKASSDISGGTPGKSNSVIVHGYDQLPLTADSVKYRSDSTIAIFFSKPLKSSAVKPSGFTLTPAASVKFVSADYESKVITVLFNAKLQPGTQYQLSFSNLADCSGNTLTSDDPPTTFKTPALPVVKPVTIRTDTGRIFITEIFADPSPEVGLPLVEFAEIYNAGADSVSLENYTFHDHTSKAVFKKHLLAPRQYAILCPLADTLIYQSFGKVIGLSPWPSLNNAGEELILKSFSGRKVDSVFYSDTWYRDPVKKQGGWSLERVDIASACGEFNWKASTDPAGGTPGKTNSVYIPRYDQITLKTDSVKLRSDTTLSLYFNKHLDISSVNNLSFALTPNNPVRSFTADDKRKELLIVFAKKLVPATTYTLSVTGVRDCGGSLVSSVNPPQTFKTAAAPVIRPVIVRPDTARIFITEIFADPSPEVGLPLAEFVEIYNAGKDTVDLKGYSLNDAVSKAVLSATLIAPKQYLVLCPASDTALYKLTGKTAGLAPWPSLNNASDQVILKSFNQRTVDSLFYTDNWYRDNIKKQGGWSLERVDINSRCAEFNWQASTDKTGGTPGRVNSVWFENYDLAVLKIDSLRQSSDTTLTLHFNKHLNLASVGPESFSVSPAQPVKSLKMDAAATQLTLVFQQKLIPSTNYSIGISGLKDCGLQNATSLQTAFRSAAAPAIRPDTSLIYITEILPDPSPEVGLPLAEFIEIYNHGKDTSNLEGWTLNTPSSKTTIRGGSIRPGQYIILCPAADTTLYQSYGKTIGLSPWPALANSGSKILLKSFRNRLIDSLAYSDNWYRDPSKKQGGWSLERVDIASACGDFNWKSSIDAAGGTPGKTNSVYVSGYDGIVLKADSLKLRSDTSLTLYFNKHLDISSINVKSISLSPEEAIRSFTTDDKQKELSVIFTRKLVPSTTYTVSVMGIRDCSGNIISTANPSLNFRTPALPVVKPVTIRTDTGRIFITEIFADPSPEVGLPLVEFAEIYNAGADSVSLENYTFHDHTSKAIFKKHLLAPRQYAILCPLADTLNYQSFGKVIGLSPWPSLNNAGEELILKSFSGRRLDSVSYSDTWYRDPVKKQGGWSLERVDIASACGEFNWKASTDPAGGTPGKTNSVYIPRYDQITLKTDSVKLRSDTTLSLYFNKHLDISSVNNLSFALTPNNPVRSFTADDKRKELLIVFAKKLVPATSYTLSVTGIRDCGGSLVSPGNPPQTFKTAAAPVIRPVIVRPDTARIFITEIFADPSPEVGLPLAEFVEIYNAGKDTVDLKGYSLNDPQTRGVIKSSYILPGQYLILCPVPDTAAFQAFGKTEGLTAWPSLNNAADQISLKSHTGKLIDSVAFSDNWYRNKTKRSGGWSLERIDVLSACKSFNWFSSIDNSGGTPGRQNSVHVQNYDGMLLRTDSIFQSSDTTLSLFFNKSLDPLSVLLENFSFSPFIAIKKLLIDDSARQVSITFSQKLTPSQVYLITTRQLKDCGGNATNINLSFASAADESPRTAVRSDNARVLITEILADPSPEVKLPLAEFVEVFNAGKDTVNLEGWTLSDPDTKALFKKSLLSPGEYLILCPAADTAQYKLFGKALGLSPWPSLNNSSDLITLKTHTGRVADSVSYIDTWFRDPRKKQGGWTLERRDNFSKCNKFNWRQSVDESGGTPGKQNSVYIPEYDNIPFKADSVRMSSDSSIVISFNKHVDPSTAGPGGLTLNPAMGNLKSVIFDPDFLNMTLLYNTKFQPGTAYQIVLTAVKDCSGNEMTAGGSLGFSTPLPPPVRSDTAMIFISEILADPSPEIGLPLSEFVEIYNPGSDTINLDGWSLSTSSVKSAIKKSFILPGEYIIFCPQADTLQFGRFGKVIGLSPWPALNNSGAKIILKSFKGRVSDSVFYSDSWYKDPVKKAGGWTLELIDHKSFCSGIQRWAQSTDPSGGTPGKKNSVNKQPGPDLPVKILSASLIDSLSIQVTFNRSCDSLPLADPKNYSLNNGLGSPLAAIPVYPSFEQVILKYPNRVARGSTYTVTAKNITDCGGTLIASAGNSAEFFVSKAIEPGDILISEILFNPRPNGFDFLEIFNRSADLLDLKELFLAPAVNSPASNTHALSKNRILIKPGEYYVLTVDPDNIKKEYPSSKGSFIKMFSMPGFNDDSGTATLLSSGRVIDQLTYNRAMHFQLIKNPEGISLERSSFVNPANEPGNFRSAAASAGFATPGYENSQLSNTQLSEEEFSIGKMFSPDNDGLDDIMEIHYKFAKTGLIANVEIYNDGGVLIRRIAANATLASQGTFTWDGLNTGGQICRAGIYLVYAELFDIDGNIKKYRRACVLAGKL